MADEAVLAASQLRVSLVIPARNEARNLPHVLARLPHGLFEVILVDGQSIDDTVDVARRHLPTIRVVHQACSGKGNALACGFAAAKGDVIVMLDADGSTQPEEIPRFVAALCSGADLAKGSRFAPGGGSADITALRRLGNMALVGLVSRLFNTEYTDLCYGFNAFWSRCLPTLDVDCDGFEVETLINIRAATAVPDSGRGAQLRARPAARTVFPQGLARRAPRPPHGAQRVHIASFAPSSGVVRARSRGRGGSLARRRGGSWWLSPHVSAWGLAGIQVKYRPRIGSHQRLLLMPFPGDESDDQQFWEN